MHKLTDLELKELNDILDAVEDHPGFISGRDVAKIAEILVRLFEDKPEPKKAPAKKSPAKKEASE